MALFKAQNSFGEVDIPDELVERYEAQGWTRVVAEPVAEEKRGPGRPAKSE